MKSFVYCGQYATANSVFSPNHKAFTFSSVAGESDYRTHEQGSMNFSSYRLSLSKKLLKCFKNTNKEMMSILEKLAI